LGQAVGTLSGGNQQKVVLAKWLIKSANIFLLDEPTRGIDVAARRRIHQLIQTWTRSGRAVIMVSSEIEALMENCDCIVRTGQREHFMRHGHPIFYRHLKYARDC